MSVACTKPHWGPSSRETRSMLHKVIYLLPKCICSLLYLFPSTYSYLPLNKYTFFKISRPDSQHSSFLLPLRPPLHSLPIHNQKSLVSKPDLEPPFPLPPSITYPHLQTLHQLINHNPPCISRSSPSSHSPPSWPPNRSLLLCQTQP